MDKYPYDTRLVLQEILLRHGAPSELFFASKESYTNMYAYEALSKRPEAFRLVNFAASKGNIPRLRYLFAVGNNFKPTCHAYYHALSLSNFETCAMLRHSGLFAEDDPDELLIIKKEIFKSFFLDHPQDCEAMRIEFTHVLHTLDDVTLVDFFDFIVCHHCVNPWPFGIHLVLERLKVSLISRDYFNDALQGCRYETRLLGSGEKARALHSGQLECFNLIINFAKKHSLLNFNCGVRFTPLQRACGMPLSVNSEIIIQMLHNGADPNFRGTEGRGDFPLYWLMKRQKGILRLKNSQAYAWEQNIKACLALLHAGSNVDSYHFAPYIFHQPIEIFTLFMQRMSYQCFKQAFNLNSEAFLAPKNMRTEDFWEKWKCILTIHGYDPKMFSVGPSFSSATVDEWALLHLNLDVLKLTLRHMSISPIKQRTIRKLLALCIYEKCRIIPIDINPEKFKALEVIQNFLESEVKLFAAEAKLFSKKRARE